MQWNLIRLRKENEFTQKQISDLLGINLTTYINKESSNSQFKANEMFLLRDLFKKRIEEIFLPTNCTHNVILEDIEQNSIND